MTDFWQSDAGKEMHLQLARLAGWGNAAERAAELGMLPPARDLIRQLERGMNQGQRERYAVKITTLVLLSQPVEESKYGGDIWIRLTPLELFACATPDDEIRGRAILETL